MTPTEDLNKILASFSMVEIGGSSDFLTALQVAQLALKHRKNRNGGQRIIMFIGSPIRDDAATLQKVGKQLKKNNVFVDCVQLGDNEGNSEKLSSFIEAVNSNDNR